MMNVLEYSTPILDKVQWPNDLRKLSIDELPKLCEELRCEIIKHLSQNPGHFAANLGTVELTVALHYVFDTPDDRILWDVGHQAYTHKLLTGRRNQFHTNRQKGGIKPFPSPDESEYDPFTCGHASNSISAALGMAVANRIKKNPHKVVAVIGDGAMSGGLAFEGLNNASSSQNDLLIILNDNEMSIDNSVGGMRRYLLNLTTSNPYNSLRYTTAKALYKMGVLTESRRKALIRLGNSLKAAISERQNIFEGLNIRYFGPNDGHDIKELVRILQDIKDMKGPKLLHLVTKKGKGYEPAEADPTPWHAPGQFDPMTGKRNQTSATPPTHLKFQDVFGYTLLELAKKEEKIVGITPAMPSGCSMCIMQKEMPERVFDVGIAEGHAVTFSGGLAKEGLIPFCNIYSSFMQRAYDNWIHDVALPNLPVVLCLDRAGLVGADGPTHHGAFDLASLRAVPNTVIASPMDGQELRHLMYTASKGESGPFVIRYPRGTAYGTYAPDDWNCPMKKVKIGTARPLRFGDTLCVLSLGPLGFEADKAIEALEKKHDVKIGHVDMRFIKPLDTKCLHEVCKQYDHLLTLEDGAILGGLASAVSDFIHENDYCVHLHTVGLPDSFVPHGTPAELYADCGMDTVHLTEKMELILDKI